MRAAHAGDRCVCAPGRMPLQANDIRPARLIRNMIGRMKVYCAICFDTTTINDMCTHTTACKLLKEDDEHPSKDIEDVTFKRDAQVQPRWTR